MKVLDIILLLVSSTAGGIIGSTIVTWLTPKQNHEMSQDDYARYNSGRENPPDDDSDDSDE